jgi:hypothetical protein
MGVLAGGNRRTVILAPGKHTLTAKLTLDTDYVNIVSLSTNPDDTIVIGTIASSALVEQTADTINLLGFTITNESTTAPIGFYQNAAASNVNSVYRYMDFYTPGDSCYAGDKLNGNITGRFERCVGGNESFGGCGGRGMPIDVTAVFIDCEAGYKSYAIGYECAGTFIRCTGGDHCFGGYSSSYYGKFTGYAEDCEASGQSFGMGDGDPSGHTKCYLSGKLKNCILGSKAKYAVGVLDEEGTTPDFYDRVAAASVTTAQDGANNDLTLTMQDKGAWGNDYSLTYLQYGGGPTGLGNIHVIDNVIRVYIDSGVSTAADVKGYIEADADTTDLVTVTYADGDGSGTVTTMSAIDFSDGLDKPYMNSNHPWLATRCTANQTVRGIDNGHKFTNEGATGSVEFTLPPALMGLSYTFVKVTQQDVLITPNGTDTIDGLADLDNTAAESDKFVTLECFADGEWLSTVKTGTWA